MPRSVERGRLERLLARRDGDRSTAATAATATATRLTTPNHPALGGSGAADGWGHEEALPTSPRVVRRLERGSNVGHGAGGRVHLGDAADTQIRRPERSVQPAVGSRVGNAHDFGAHFEEQAGLRGREVGAVHGGFGRQQHVEEIQTRAHESQHVAVVLERTDVSNRGDHSGGWHHRAQASGYALRATVAIADEERACTGLLDESLSVSDLRAAAQRQLRARGDRAGAQIDGSQLCLRGRCVVDVVDDSCHLGSSIPGEAEKSVRGQSTLSEPARLGVDLDERLGDQSVEVVGRSRSIRAGIGARVACVRTRVHLRIRGGIRSAGGTA